MTDETDTSRSRETSPTVLVAVLLVTFLALCGATFLLPHDSYIRYQQLAGTMHNRTIWSYERLHFDDTPIDIAVIGNSRVKSAVGAPILGQELEQRLGRPVNVVNLSLPQEGRNAQYIVARELLKTHPETRLVILSAIEQMPRDGHPAFRNLADASDALSAPLLVNADYVNDLAFQPFRQMSLFVQSAFPEAFDVKAQFDASDYEGSSIITRGSGMPGSEEDGGEREQMDEEGLSLAARNRVRGISPPVMPASMANREFAMERAYTDSIAALAAETDTRLSFLYMPIYENHEPLRQQAYYKGLGEVIHADFIADRYELFLDYGHINAEGTDVLMPWLADEIVERQLLRGESGND